MYGDDSDMSDIAGMEISGPETSEEEVSEMLAEEPESVDEKPLMLHQYQNRAYRRGGQWNNGNGMVTNG